MFISQGTYQIWKIRVTDWEIFWMREDHWSCHWSRLPLGAEYHRDFTIQKRLVKCTYELEWLLLEFSSNSGDSTRAFITRAKKTSEVYRASRFSTYASRRSYTALQCTNACECLPHRHWHDWSCIRQDAKVLKFPASIEISLNQTVQNSAR